MVKTVTVRESEGSTATITRLASDFTQSSAITTSSSTISRTARAETPASTTTKAATGGYTTDQKIALGCGIGIGLPTLLVHLFLLYWKYLKRKQDKDQRDN